MSVGSRQRLRVRVEGTVQGVGFRPFVYRLADELGLSGWVLNDSRGVLIEAEGEPGALARLLERLRSDAPPLAIVERVSDEPLDPTGEPGFRITRERGPGGGRCRHLARRGDLRRLSRRGDGSGQPAPPLSVHELHQLRAAIHDRSRSPIRPPPDDDGVVRDVPAVPGRVRGPARPPLPRPAQRLPGLRAVPPPRRSSRTGRRRGERGLARGDRPGPRRGQDRRGQGNRRIPPRLPGGRRGGRGGASRTQAPGGQALRPDGARRRACARAGRARRCRGQVARLARAADRAGPAPAGCAGCAVGRAGRPRSRRHAALLAAPSPPARRCRCRARPHQRQRLRRADRLPGYRRPGAALGHRRSLPHGRPADRDADRRLGGAGGRGTAAVPAPQPRLRASRPAARCAPSDPRLRRRAQEHLLPGQGRTGLGRPPHRRPEELRDAALVHRGNRALRAPLRGQAGAGRARPPPGVPLDQVRARAGGCGDGGCAAPPCPSRLLPGGASRARPGGRGDLRRHRLRNGRDGVGRGAAGRGCDRLRAPGKPSPGAHARR